VIIINDIENLFNVRQTISSIESFLKDRNYIFLSNSKTKISKLLNVEVNEMKNYNLEEFNTFYITTHLNKANVKELQFLPKKSVIIDEYQNSVLYEKLKSLQQSYQIYFDIYKNISFKLVKDKLIEETEKYR
jgi:hypothetical protein